MLLILYVLAIIQNHRIGDNDWNDSNAKYLIQKAG